MNNTCKYFIHIPIKIKLLSIFFTKVFLTCFLLVIYIFTKLFLIHSCIRVCFHPVTRSLIGLIDLFILTFMVFICINSYCLLYLLAYLFDSYFFV